MATHLYHLRTYYCNYSYWHHRQYFQSMVHTEFWDENSRTFQGLKFPAIWHKIRVNKETRNTITNLCTAQLSNYLVCKTMLFNWGYFIQGAFTKLNIHYREKNQGLTVFSRTYKFQGHSISRTLQGHDVFFKYYSRPVRTIHRGELNRWHFRVYFYNSTKVI